MVVMGGGLVRGEVSFLTKKGMNLETTWATQILLPSLPDKLSECMGTD